MNSRHILALAAIAGGSAVIMGALGAHLLRPAMDPEQRALYATAVNYHFYHALALMVIGIRAQQRRSARPRLSIAAWAICIGILLFSGSLYLLALGGGIWLSFVPPFGAMALLIGWGALVLCGLQRSQRSKIAKGSELSTPQS
jgi:uncharacterized membrane protein YgdD (TMEM256/DUF423 family)